MTNVAVIGSLALLLCCEAVQAAEAPQLIGMAEETTRTYAPPGGKPQTTYFRRVRVAFHKDGQNWKAFSTQCEKTSACVQACDCQNNCHACIDQCVNGCASSLSAAYPAKLAWTVAFQGKALGQVNSHVPSHIDFYSEFDSQDINDTSPPPTVGPRSTEYAGWTHEAVYRPLVAVAQPYFKDSQRWQAYKLTADEQSRARGQFRKQFPKADNCVSPGENIGRPWAYKDKDISILRAYRSKDRWTLIKMALGHYNCDGPIQDKDDPFADQCFVISPSGEMNYLDSGLHFLDSGDYGNDGKSEVIFTIDRYNRGGYELFYDDFKKHAVFEYGYH